MTKCPVDLIEAAVGDRLPDDQTSLLQAHLSSCEECCQRMDAAAANATWWTDASRLLDDSLLDDPGSDVADSSAADSRLFEDDDPVGELKAAGVIDDAATHPETLGKLGRYTIEREIGSGGMGVVLKGFDPELNRTVAIKVLAPHLARSAAARRRFVREGRAAAAVVHENIVAIHEVDTSGRLPTLVMHCVDGVSLQRHVDTIGPLPVSDALRIAAQTSAGLAAAHRQGIIHRDVKPANILVGGGGQRVWITDFGLARAVDDASLTRTGFIAGTPHYMSPEQARGGSLGASSDLFSLGSVIYFMLVARPPWRAERSLAVLHRIVQHEHRPLWKINPDVPREVSDLVDRLLSKLPEQRGESAAQIQHDLEETLSKLQNPDSPHFLSHGEMPVKIEKPKFFARPWFVVPATAVATVLAMAWYQGNLPWRDSLLSRSTDSPITAERSIANIRQPAIAGTSSIIASNRPADAGVADIDPNYIRSPNQMVARDAAGEPNRSSDARPVVSSASSLAPPATFESFGGQLEPASSDLDTRNSVRPSSSTRTFGSLPSSVMSREPESGFERPPGNAPLPIAVPEALDIPSSISETTEAEISRLQFMLFEIESIVLHQNPSTTTEFESNYDSY